MSKKSLDIKPAQKFITESRDNGKTDQEIYNELTQQYFNKERFCIADYGHTQKQTRRNINFNNILIGILSLVVSLRACILSFYFDIDANGDYLLNQSDNQE